MGRTPEPRQESQLRQELEDARERLARVEHQLAHHRQLLGDAQRLAKLGSWERDIASGDRFWSEELFRIHGLEPAGHAPAREVTDPLTHPDDVETYRNWRDEITRRPGETVEVTVRILVDGEEHTLRARGMMLVDDAGEPIRVVGTVQDISAEVRSRHTETLLAEIVRSAEASIYTVGLDQRVRSWNPAAERLYGYTAAEAIGRSIDIFQPPDASEEQRRLRAVRLPRILAGETLEPFEERRCRKDGSIVHVRIQSAALRDADGTIVGLVTSARDITERRDAENRLDRLASFDELTGLFNRYRFDDELASASARADQDAVQGAVMLVGIDADAELAADSDVDAEPGTAPARGTPDALIVDVAGVLSEEIGDAGVLARVGPDEFAVLLMPATGEEANLLARRLLGVVRGIRALSPASRPPTVSIGLASFGHGTRTTNVRADAARAMFESADAGGDRLTVFSPADRPGARRASPSATEDLLREALRSDLFELVAQPIVNLETGLMSQVEVLLRLPTETGLASPSDFLPAAERVGIMHLIDFWVISRALAAAAQFPDLTFHINMSGLTVVDSRLASVVARGLRESGVEPARVVFELTETAAIDNIARARDAVRQVAELGCGFAIDDFGAGFSTFYYLKHFPADFVKIDGEFTKDPRTPTDEIVIDSIVTIARDLGKQTIAEYIGDVSTLDRVRAIGVDFGQGHLFSRPFPIADLATAPRRYPSGPRRVSGSDGRRHRAA